MTSWAAPSSRLRQISASIGGEPTPDIRALPANWWRRAYDLDANRLAPDLNWPEPLAPTAYKQSLLTRLSDFMNGRQREVWITTDSRNQLNGLAAIQSEWTRSHVVTLRVGLDAAGQVERPLLSKVIRRLGYLSRRNVRIDHPEDDTIVNDLLSEANFSLQRTLTHMRYDLP
jgi:hypothetical protein